jgi:hypothetical protein
METVLDAVFSIMALISGGFLAWGGWLCLRHLVEDRVRAELRKIQEGGRPPRGAQLS